MACPDQTYLAAVEQVLIFVEMARKMARHGDTWLGLKMFEICESHGSACCCNS